MHIGDSVSRLYAYSTMGEEEFEESVAKKDDLKGILEAISAKHATVSEAQAHILRSLKCIHLRLQSRALSLCPTRPALVEQVLCVEELFKKRDDKRVRLALPKYGVDLAAVDRLVVDALWEERHLSVSEVKNTLVVSKELQQVLTDAVLDAIFVNTKREGHSFLVMAVDFSQMPHIGCKSLPRIWAAFASLDPNCIVKAMKDEPERFCDREFVVEGKKVAVNSHLITYLGGSLEPLTERQATLQSVEDYLECLFFKGKCTLLKAETSCKRIEQFLQHCASYLSDECIEQCVERLFDRAEADSWSNYELPYKALCCPMRGLYRGVYRMRQGKLLKKRLARELNEEVSVDSPERLTRLLSKLKALPSYSQIPLFREDFQELSGFTFKSTLEGIEFSLRGYDLAVVAEFLEIVESKGFKSLEDRTSLFALRCYLHLKLGQVEQALQYVENYFEKGSITWEYKQKLFALTFQIVYTHLHDKPGGHKRLIDHLEQIIADNNASCVSLAYLFLISLLLRGGIDAKPEVQKAFELLESKNQDILVNALHALLLTTGGAYWQKDEAKARDLFGMDTTEWSSSINRDFVNQVRYIVHNSNTCLRVTSSTSAEMLFIYGVVAANLPFAFRKQLFE